ncbi:MAG: adenylosuccinate lyase [Thermoflexibacter sp.]|nr:adenylosuccinate lyase [Thermoflexibacter sp.]
MNLNTLTAISPVDGRYRKQVNQLADYFSEYALIKYRVRVEIEYFIALCELPLPQLSNFDSELFSSLRGIYENFSLEDAQKVKATEQVTNHDVKAVEYFIKEQFEKLGIAQHQEFVHFGLTSQDINNTAIPLLFKEAIHLVFNPLYGDLVEKMSYFTKQWADVPMLAFTHGQPASPTRLGKELGVFVYRLQQQIAHLADIPYSAKFGGATGNMNAHLVSYPHIDWFAFADNFVNDVLGLHRSLLTTQIENYDNFAAMCDSLRRINTILIDFSRDIWTYISMGYFKQKINPKEVGSSAMPHKVNPIDFENAEGNLGIANALFSFFAEKLPVSRLQRDLTDSTVLRNIGIPFSHTVIAFKSLLKGLNKLEMNQERINEDLQDNWAVVAEAIQNILRREGYPQPYETLKALTRKSEKITAEVISNFVDNLDIRIEVKEELKQITPFNYLGIRI